MNNEHASTNYRVYFDIAVEAYTKMLATDKKGIRPRSDGIPGNIITLDPERTNFKNAMISIVFFGVYLESLLHLALVKKYGKEDVDKTYDQFGVVKKAIKLGISDKDLIVKITNFNDSRNDIIHEKAYLKTETLKFAQNEALKAYNLINELKPIIEPLI